MNQSQWATEVLSALGIEPTPANVSWLSQWTNAESPWGTAVYGNPLNIEGFAGGYNPSATAAWLSSNGGYGGTGTYAQEISSYLNGLPNQLAKAFSYFSGANGNTSSLTDSYKNLLGANSQTLVPLTAQGQLNAAAATGANPQQMQAQANANDSFFTPLVQALESGGLLIAAALLISIGGLWIVLSNKDTQTVVTEGVKAAVAS